MKAGPGRALTAISTRNLNAPVLLFLASHRPVAFVAGQFVLALAPLAELFDICTCRTWAQLLSDPNELDRLEEALSRQADQNELDEPVRGDSLSKPTIDTAAAHVLE